MQAAEDGSNFSSPSAALVSGSAPVVPSGRYLKVNVAFTRSTDTDNNVEGGDGIFDGPILKDLTVTAVLPNKAPDCSQATPSTGLIWPPDHKFVPVTILGLTDQDNDSLAVKINSIFQDEPTDTNGDGSFTPDGEGIGTDTAQVRAERSGTNKVPGNGRVYHIKYTASDTSGGSCSGEVTVGVPHDQGNKATPVDGGALYDSTIL